MVRFRPPSLGATLGSSSSPAGENAVDLAHHSISLAILPRLPLPQAAPTLTDSRRWLSCVPFAERPFNVFMLQSGDVLFSSSVAFSSTKRSDALLHYSVAEAPLSRSGSFFAPLSNCYEGISLISYLLRQQIVPPLCCKTHSFFTSWGEFTPTLEDVAILLKLPMFGDFGLSATVLDRHIAKMSKSLKIATLESAKHSRACLPLASFYLGSLYGRLDQLQEQMFPDCGLVRRIPKLLVGDSSPPEYRVKGWSLGRPRQPLINLIDDEGSFVFRPYTSSFFSGTPVPLELGPLLVHEAIKVVLFEEWHRLPPFDSSLLVPPDRVGRVLDEFLSCKDPYYVISVATDQDKSDASSKKRKSASSQKGKAKVLAPTRPIKKVPMRIPSVTKRPFSQVATPRRASTRLKARPAQESGKEGSSDSSDNSQDSPLLSHPPCLDSTQNTPPGNPDTKRANGSGSLREMQHASGQAQAIIHNFSVEVVNMPARLEKIGNEIKRVQILEKHSCKNVGLNIILLILLIFFMPHLLAP
ncbi:CHD3-type chromatin-remodeling factor PICKLE [Sesbania bispinosa]|nr:CHD3-type chromatin-remodeling factor PICKLE [Sesbania bispinosa]